MGLGFAVLAAPARARRGRHPSPVVAPGAWARWRAALARPGSPLPHGPRARGRGGASRRPSGARVWFLVDSLDHLRRGGRLSAPAAALGTVLGLRPLLTVRDGRIDVAEKVRTRRAARERLEELARRRRRHARAPVRVAVHHLGQPDAGQEVAASG